VNLVLLSDQGNSSTINVNTNDLGNQRIVIPESLAMGNANAFTKLISNQYLDKSVDLIGVKEVSWKPLVLNWTGQSDATISGIGQGYRGVVWKETFVSNWDFAPLNSNLSRSASPLEGYYSGPGFVYIPLSSDVHAVGIHYNPFDPIIDSFLVSSLIAAVILIGLHFDLPQRARIWFGKGRQKRGTGQSVD
jgi:hypothetical protein